MFDLSERTERTERDIWCTTTITAGFETTPRQTFHRETVWIQAMRIYISSCLSVNKLNSEIIQLAVMCVFKCKYR
jgi:hypothetical protein